MGEIGEIGEIYNYVDLGEIGENLQLCREIKPIHFFIYCSNQNTTIEFFI